MKSIRDVQPPQHQVIAEFKDSALAFRLPREATFADLAACLAALGLAHRGGPIRIEVTVGV